MYLPLPYPYPTSKESSMQKQTVVITDSKVIEVFEALVEQCDTTDADQKIATGEKNLRRKAHSSKRVRSLANLDSQES